MGGVYTYAKETNSRQPPRMCSKEFISKKVLNRQNLADKFPINKSKNFLKMGLKGAENNATP